MKFTRCFIVILTIIITGYFTICIDGAEMFVTDPGRGAIYVGVSDDTGSFAESNFTALPLQNLILPWAIAFDNRSRSVFWTDGSLNAILRANIDGSGQEIVVKGLGFPAGLAIDTVNKRLYYTDYEGDIIGSSTLDGTDDNVLVNGPELQKPQGITVSTRYSLLFWADTDLNSITRVNTNGSNLTILRTGLNYPIAVSLNKEGNICTRSPTVTLESDTNTKTDPSSDTSTRGVTESENTSSSTTGASSTSRPRIILISVASIIGILAFLLFIALGINIARSERTQTTNKPPNISNEDRCSRSNTELVPSNRLPMTNDNDEQTRYTSLDPHPSRHVYEEPGDITRRSYEESGDITRRSYEESSGWEFRRDIDRDGSEDGYIEVYDPTYQNGNVKVLHA